MKKKAEKPGERGVGRSRIPIVISILFLLIVLAFVLWRNSKEKPDAGAAGQELLEKYWSTVEEDELVAARRSTAEVVSGNRSGGGVILESDADGIWVVTAAHVIENASEVSVSFRAGSSAAAVDVRTDPETDLAFCRIAPDAVPEDVPAEIAAARLEPERYDTLQKDDYIFLRDHAGTNELGYTFSMAVDPFFYIEDFGAHMLLLYGTASAGQSGEGAYTDDGCLVGIVAGANDDGDVVCVPLNVILGRYELFRKSLEVSG